MRLAISFIIVISLTSCGKLSPTKVHFTPVDNNWEITRLTTQKHFYNDSGLLDRTQRDEVYYGNGKPRYVMTFTIVRHYDKRNLLLSERKFENVDTGKELSEEKFFEYDERNNLIFKVEKFHGDVNEIVKATYDKFDQKTQEVSVLRHLDSIPSPLYYNHKNKLFDTSKVSYEYNQDGDLVKESYADQTVTTLYSNGIRTFSYNINSKGDTLRVRTYKVQGHITTEFIIDKLDPLRIEQKVYDGNKILEELYIDNGRNYKHKEIHKYDKSDNEVEDVTYK